MSQTWPGTEAGLVTCPMQHVLDEKKGKLLRNGRKGQWEPGNLLIGGPKRLKNLQPPATGASGVAHRDQGRHSSQPYPMLYLMVLMEKEGLNSLFKYPGGCVLQALQCLSIIAPCWLFFFLMQLQQ